jgi:hypothetical protein
MNKDLEYYPLRSGNYFEYKTYSRLDPLPETDSSAYSIRILGDTILENGKRYKILSQNSIPASGFNYFIYERIDSLTGSVYKYDKYNSRVNNEYKTDSLLAQTGDTIRCSSVGVSSFGSFRTICTSVKTDILFGLTVDIKEFYDHSFIPGSDYKLAKGFGIYFRESSEFSWSMSKLVYAEIDGKKFGKTITSVGKKDASIPYDFKLYPNYPNPFNPNTTIVYEIPVYSHVKIIVYNSLGEEVRILQNKYLSPGNYKLNFNAGNFASGVYFYQLLTDAKVLTKKLLLIK